MSNLEKFLRMLQSEKASVRYEACEELRVRENLPKSALLALQTATNDNDPLVADAARRALLLHSEPEIVDQSSLDEKLESKNSTLIGESAIGSAVELIHQWEYKNLIVNYRSGKVESIDGVPEISGSRVIFNIFLFIISFIGGAGSGDLLDAHTLDINKALSNLKSEGWEVDQITNLEVDKWSHTLKESYTLKRPMRRQQLVSEHVDVEKINPIVSEPVDVEMIYPIWEIAKPFVFAFIGGMVFLVLEVLCSIGSTGTYKQFIYDPNNPDYPIWISGYIIQPFFSALLGGYYNNKIGWSALPSIILGFVSGIVYFILYIIYVISLGY